MGSIPVLEIGGTHVTAAVVETGLWQVRIETAVRRPIDPHGLADALIATMVNAGKSLRPDDGLLWGVAIPGPFDYARGVADFHGVGKFDALRGIDLGDVLRRELTGGTGHIAFVNDAEAFAIGEWAAGATQGHHRTIAVTLGTGVGSAFLVDGLARRQGPGVPPDGRLDLVQVDGHPLEDSVSRRAIRARYAVLAGDRAAGQLDVREIVARARSGDHDATRAVDESLQVLEGPSRSPGMSSTRLCGQEWTRRHPAGRKCSGSSPRRGSGRRRSLARHGMRCTALRPSIVADTVPGRSHRHTDGAHRRGWASVIHIWCI
jgi:glucokinase